MDKIDERRLRAVQDSVLDLARDVKLLPTDSDLAQLREHLAVMTAALAEATSVVATLGRTDSKQPAAKSATPASGPGTTLTGYGFNHHEYQIGSALLEALNPESVVSKACTDQVRIILEQHPAEKIAKGLKVAEGFHPRSTMNLIQKLDSLPGAELIDKERKSAFAMVLLKDCTVWYKQSGSHLEAERVFIALMGKLNSPDLLIPTITQLKEIGGADSIKALQVLAKRVPRVRTECGEVAAALMSSRAAGDIYLMLSMCGYNAGLPKPTK